MDPFSYPAIGDPRATNGAKLGSTAGSSIDIIRPVSQQVDKAFQPGRVQTFEWRSDPNRHYMPRHTRLALDLEFMFGEVDTTKSDVTKAPQDKFAPPSRDVSLCALPGAQLFDSQVRFSANNVVVEQTNFYSDMAHAQLLTTTSNESSSTSGSNMLMTLRKDRGTPPDLLDGTRATKTGDGSAPSDGFTRVPLSYADYVGSTNSAGAEIGKVKTSKNQAVNEILALANSRADGTGAEDYTKTLSGFTVEALALPSDGDGGTDPLDAPLLKFRLSNADEATARSQYFDLLRAKLLGKVRVFDTDGTTAKKVFGAPATNESPILDLSMGVGGNGDFKNTLVFLQCSENLTTALAGTEKVSILTDIRARAEDVGFTPVEDVAKLFAVDVPSSCAKQTTPNPKYDIIQQGYHPGTKVAHVHTMEPIMLSSWQTNYAQPSGTYKLDFTISPNYLSNLVNDISGQYGCPTTNGKMIPFGTDTPTPLARQIYCRVKDVALHVHYIHSPGPRVPMSISQKFMPFTIVKRQLRNKIIQESFTVSPATKAVLVFISQELSHVCIDNELDSRARAGGGCNVLGITNTTAATDSADYGKFEYHSRPQFENKSRIDPRVASSQGKGDSDDHPSAEQSFLTATGESKRLEKSAPMFISSLQCQIADDVQPAQMLTDQDPTTGDVARAWSLYVNFIAKSAGYRSSLMSFSEFSGYTNSNYGSAPRCGTRGVWHAFNIQTKPNSLASDLQLRGSLSGDPQPEARQFITVMALSENLYNIAYQTGPDGKANPVPVDTSVGPLV